MTSVPPIPDRSQTFRLQNEDQSSRYGDRDVERSHPNDSGAGGGPDGPPAFGRRGGDGGGGGGEPVTFTWRGAPKDLVGLSFLNFGLSLVTLGIYSFWGKAEVRRRLWSSVRINGEPLVYTGTGKELFLGFLIVILLFVLPVTLTLTALQLFFPPDSAVVILATPVIYLLILFLFGVGTYRARRYRLSRTTWRGIRGTMSGSSVSYGWSSFWTTLLWPLSLGFIIPWQSNYLNRILTNETQFGDQHMSYSGEAGPLYPRFIVMFLGIIALYFMFVGVFVWVASLAGPGAGTTFFDPGGNRAVGSLDPYAIIGMIAMVLVVLTLLLLYNLLSTFYAAKVIRHFAEHTTFMGAKFKLNVRTLSLLWITLSNFFIIVFTLTILQPVAQARLLRYYVEHLELDGAIDLEGLQQNQQRLDRLGEGLATAFDIDGF